jgi:hypothetical protein
VLLCGEADYSFATALTRVFPDELAIVATELHPRTIADGKKSSEELYPSSVPRTAALEALGHVVCGGVDATQLHVAPFANWYSVHAASSANGRS